MIFVNQEFQGTEEREDGNKVKNLTEDRDCTFISQLPRPK